MRKILFTMLLSLATAAFAFGQTFTVQVQTGTYTDLTGATSLNQGQTWDDPDYILPVGFNFPFGGKNYSTIYVSDGLIGLNVDYDTVIAHYLADLIDRGDLTGTSLSPISYKTETIGGVQVMKLEWKNFGFYNEMDSAGTLDWYGNVQLWLYANGQWAVHIGPSSIAVPYTAFFGEPGPSIGYGNLTSNHWLTGSPTAPTLTLNTSPFSIPSMSGIPASGTIYTFTPAGIGIEKPAEAPAMALYPNPVVGELSLTIPADGMVEMFDMTGQRVMVLTNLAAGNHTADVTSLASGVYAVVFTAENGARSNARIVKQ
jgi:hypothetical protein